MHSIEEKRVYGDREGALEAYVASEMGVVRVRIAGDTVGEFGLCERCDARDIAATADQVAIATAEDVLVLEREGDPDETNRTDPTVVGTDFGAAVAVGYHGDDLVAAGPDGTVACRTSDAGDGSSGDVGNGTEADDSSEWTALEDQTIAAVRAIDGGLIGTDSGVYRVHDGGLDHVGLTDVRDVAAAGVPLAATDEGLYKLGNGWMELVAEPFASVDADPRNEPGQLSRAHAVADAGECYALEGDEWVGVSAPTSAAGDDAIVAIGYGETVYAVTTQGTFLSLVDERDERDGSPADPNNDSAADPNTTADEEWRSRSLGVRGVTGLAVPPLE